MFRNVFGGCVSDRSSQAEVLRSQKLKFGASLSSALKHGILPGPLVDILVFIAKEGVATADIFRRPGNPNDTRRIVKRLTEGKQVIYSNYSFYTLASVVKKFLLKTPGGVFTPEGEEQLLLVLTIQQRTDQIEAVRNFMETLMPAHQQLIALLFGTWFRIVTFSEVNYMSVEALSRSVAGSMFHTCAEDPAKVEKASRMMQFLIDNYGVESMFGQENIRYFTEATHTTIHIRELYHYSCCAESDFIPPVQSNIIDLTRMVKPEDDDADDGGFLGRDKDYNGGSLQVSPTAMRHSDISDDSQSQININMSTLSAPEVSFVPSPEISKRPKSLEDNLNEVRSHYQSRCLSRFNSVKRKQLERLRQRSDWFLSPSVRERNNSRKGRDNDSRFFSGSSTSGGQSCDQEMSAGKTGRNNNHRNGSTKGLHQKSSSNTVVTKASSEGAVLDVFSDGDSVFTDNTSRSESPASEPVWSHILKAHSRDIIHSDTVGHLTLPELGLREGSSGFDLSMASQDEFCLPDILQQVHPSPGGSYRQHIEKEGKDTEGEEEEDDDDNTTPTGGQEEEDTIMAASLPDIAQQCNSSEGSGAHYEELDKDSPLSLKGDLQSPERVVTSKAELSDKEGDDSMQGQLKDSIAADSGAVDNKGAVRMERRQSGEIVKCFLVERRYDGEGSKDS